MAWRWKLDLHANVAAYGLLALYVLRIMWSVLYAINDSDMLCRKC